MKLAVWLRREYPYDWSFCLEKIVNLSKRVTEMPNVRPKGKNKENLSMEEISAERIVEQYSSQVFSLVVRIVGRREEAEEVTQDVFLKVFRSIDKFRGASTLSTWIYRIAYNCAISHCRKKGLKTSELNESTTNSAAEHYDEQREAQFVALEQAIQTLKVEDALLINLYYWKQMSVEQLAEITSMSQSNVKVRLHRIRGTLHKKLSDGTTR